MIEINPASPYTMLFPFQKRWLGDSSRFKMWCASRQIGKSFDQAAEINEDCFANPNTLWVVLSASEDQSKEFIDKVETWANIFGAAIEYTTQQPWEQDLEIKVSMIRYPNGSRVIGLPANPRTARGYTANVVLDEFAHHADSYKIWAAIYPTISNPLKGNLKLRILSTPNGKFNKFYELWTGKNDFSKHFTNIVDAVREGFPADMEALRVNAGDELTWRQEYLCEFLDDLDGQNLIKSEWVERAMKRPPIHIKGEVVAGCDFAFTKTGDESVIALKDGNHVTGLEGFRGEDNQIVDFFCQKFVAAKLMNGQIVGDADGGLLMLAMLRNRGWDVHGVNANAQAKDHKKFANRSAEMWFEVALMLERGELGLPDDPILFEQLCNRKLVFAENGKLRLESKKDLNKSPDRADAVVLAVNYNVGSLSPTNWVTGKAARVPEFGRPSEQRFQKQTKREGLLAGAVRH